MNLPQESLDELHAIFAEGYGLDLSDEQTRELAEGLINLYQAALRCKNPQF